MQRSFGQERTLERSDGKVTPLIGMASGCLYHLTLKPNIIQRKILMFIKLDDVNVDATLAKAILSLSLLFFIFFTPHLNFFYENQQQLWSVRW